jgi:hypothetical protein
MRSFADQTTRLIACELANPMDIDDNPGDGTAGVIDH